MTSKLSKIDLDYDLNYTGQNQGGGTDTDLYSPVHIVGSFDSWSTSAHPLTYKGNGVYEVTITINGNTQFKFTRNGNWSELNWGRGDNGANSLKLNGGGNFEITGVSGQKTVVITVDTVNLTCTWVLN